MPAVVFFRFFYRNRSGALFAQEVQHPRNQIVQIAGDDGTGELDILVEGEHGLIPFQAQRHFRDGAHAAADGDEAQTAAGDDGVTHFAHAGRDGDGQEGIGRARIFLGQDADGNATGLGRAA